MNNRYISRSTEKLYTYDSDLRTEELQEELRQLERQLCPDISEEEEVNEFENVYNFKSRKNLNRVNTKLKGLKEITKSSINLSTLNKNKY
jgi:hypothetical protein